MDILRYDQQRVLILAPHADDETIGCGGVIQKYIQCASPVRVLIASFVMSDYRKYRKETGHYQTYSGNERLRELQRAMDVLGVNDVQFMYLDKSAKTKYHSKLDAIPRVDLVTKIENHIAEFQPTVVYIPSLTKHQDHETLHYAALGAARPYFWNGSVLVYETDGELTFEPNLFIPLLKEEVQKKMEALNAFQTQVGSNLHPVHPDTMETKARFRGQRVYVEFAEAFQILRMRG